MENTVNTNRPESFLSITAASTWLKERGIKPNTRHTLYAAIAQSRLAVAAVTGRVVCIDPDELKRYANDLEHPENVSA